MRDLFRATAVLIVERAHRPRHEAETLVGTKLVALVLEELVAEADAEERPTGPREWSRRRAALTTIRTSGR